MAKANNGYQDLQVWHLAIELAEHLYRLTESFPKAEMWNLTSQLRRSAVSVASNIAEGCARESRREFFQFLSIASGSLAEAKTQLIIAQRVGIATQESNAQLFDRMDQLGRMLSGLRRSLTPDPSGKQLTTNNQQLEISN